ncbi:PREDICTED: uncharacterized protein LOC103082830 [Lipotes vexillifer]|uniref:Ferritin n=1 Tax=Lipotes vexillifer TaxID=118797 RepID=A0A340WVM8_LIPVE|nr:PREDICTED: uncharacterized protein LOC103082830 [Lipotes vexillifer]
MEDLSTLQLERCRFWHYTDDIMLRGSSEKQYEQIRIPSHTTWTSRAKPDRGHRVQYGPLTTEGPTGHKPTKSVRDHLFGNPATGDDSPKAAASTAAALTKYSGYKGWLMKPNAPANNRKVAAAGGWGEGGSNHNTGSQRGNVCEGCLKHYGPVEAEREETVLYGWLRCQLWTSILLFGGAAPHKHILRLCGSGGAPRSYMTHISLTTADWFRERPPSSLRGSYRRPRGFTFTSAFTPATMPVLSQVRQNYHPDCEAAINSHFTLQFYASFVCLSAAVYLCRDDVALKHFAWFFVRRSLEHSRWARGLKRLQNQRGGRLSFQDIRKPVSDEWKSGLKAMKCALFLEKLVNHSLLHLHQLATDKSDPHLHRFLATHHRSQQVAFISELEGHVTTLSMMGAPDVDLAGSLFDKLTLGDSDKN